jgi:hypothetical protein
VTSFPFEHTWLDPADVLAWLTHNSQSTSYDTAEVERVCSQTEAYVQRCRPEFLDALTDPPVYLPDAETYQGAVMYGARELRRKGSPAGVETIADGGATFVAQFDADIERALRTGTYTRPGAG